MHTAFVLALTSLLFLALPASACGGPGTAEDAGEYQYCHDYTIHAGDERTGVHANEGGQFLVAYNDDTGLGLFRGLYVESDVAYLGPENDGTPWSIWIYSEENGHPGVQRADEVCNNTPEGWESDVTIC